ncbi:response regulator [Novosphingobium resinovorum]|nr:response regulator [Novosphingobium resinovorum]
MGSTVKRRVLLVEDEAIIRLIGSDALEDAGYEVLDAASADEALRILETIDDVAIVFTDIRMPGSMDGLELARLVHERWPDIRLLITSGDTWPPRALIPDEGRFIAKPYELGQLRCEVSRLLD